MTGDPPAEAPPYLLLGPQGARTPLVLAVPHAGRHYPAALERARAVPLRLLEQLEDRAADLLIEDAVAEGAAAVVATHARAWIDLNRGESDREDGGGGHADPRVRAGLGLVPSRLGGRPLWRLPPGEAETMSRIARVHGPYHAAVAGALAEARARHGFAVLLDCHSMPPLGRAGAAPARIVLGDRHGTSAAPGIVRAAADAARGLGFRVAINAPYAGAYTLERHGRPRRRIHAIQLEIDRTLYLTPDLREPSAGVAAIRRLVAAVGCAAVAAAGAGAMPLAAE